MRPRDFLQLAAQVSRLGEKDGRAYFHGAVGVRRDGPFVLARNGVASDRQPKMHAEYRALRKCGAEAVIYVARTLADGRWADSTPCGKCMERMRKMRTRSVYFTTGPDSWACIHLER